MKKQYVKPEVLFESFSMSTSIAAGCEVQTNQARYTCAYEVGRSSTIKNVFTADISGCTYSEGVVTEADGTPSYDGICYHVPLESNNLFTS